MNTNKTKNELFGIRRQVIYQAITAEGKANRKNSLKP